MAHNCKPADTASVYAREALAKVEFGCGDSCGADWDSLPPLSRALIDAIPVSESDYQKVIQREDEICRSIEKVNPGVAGIQCPTIFKEFKDLPQVVFLRPYDILRRQRFSYSSGIRAQEGLKHLDQALPQVENALATLSCDPKFQGEATSHVAGLKRFWKEELTERFAKIEIAQYEGKMSPDFPVPKFSLGDGFEYVCSEFGCVDYSRQTTSGKGLAELKRQHPEAYEQAVAPLVSFGQKLGVDFSNHPWEYHVVTRKADSEEPPAGKKTKSGCGRSALGSETWGI